MERLVDASFKATCLSVLAGPLAAVGVLAGCGLGVSACEGCGARPAPQEARDASEGPAGVSVADAQLVLAKVGQRTITLGEYAAVLERMNRFERLRYQSSDRRQELLDELIDLELLAQEAERRGLADEPEVKAREEAILREELLREVRQQVGAPEDVPEQEVRRYYEAHRAEFNEPERRRLAHIAVASEAQANQVLSEARSADARQWGALVRKHSLDAPARAKGLPDELAGDLGIVTSDGDDVATRAVPKALREAAFELTELGEVYPRVLQAGGAFHVLRLIGKTAARQRSLQEAKRAIRVAVVRERVRQAEADLEGSLRKKFDVEIDQEALRELEQTWRDSSGRGSGHP